MLRNVHRWLPGYFASLLRRPRASRGERHLVLCLADHFEPFHRTVESDGNVSGGCSVEEARARVADWSAAHREVAGAVTDADGRPFRRTFFYPAEEYDRECVDRLRDFCAQGNGEVEVHLHHRNDTADGLHMRLVEFRDRLAHEHGLLGRMGDRPSYAFVHGNWALCNSRPDRDWCGVDAELAVLGATGCYADFTFPSAPSATQPRLVNAIYRARDLPHGPGGCATGTLVRAAAPARPGTGRDEGLMLVTGPLAPDWRSRRFGLLPRIENADVGPHRPTDERRVESWVRVWIHVAGRPDVVFVKLHTHGLSRRRTAQEDAMAQMGLARAAAAVCAREGWTLHFCTAREVYNLVRSMETGLAGTIQLQMEHEIAAPPACRA